MKTPDFYFLYPNLCDCSIQTFDDAGKKDGRLAGIYDREKGNDKALKLNEKGAGIFFSVNSMEKGKRGVAYVTNINAWICEMDNYTKEEQKEKIKGSPLKPSAIVESNKSYHLYRFAQDGTKENRKTICKGLRDYFDGDPAVVDIARVLRLPGYKHVKDITNPFPVECIYIKDTKYTEEEMMEAFPYAEPVKGRKQVVKTKYDGDDIRYVLNGFDCEVMLERLSGSYLVNGDRIDFVSNSNGTKQIVVNGESTACWIDANQKIGSADQGGPSWINRVMRYRSISKRDIYDWAMSNCKDMIPQEYYTKEIKPKKSEEKDIFDKTTPFTRGLLSLDKKFGKPDYHDLCVLLGYPFTGKTAFTFFMAKNNAYNGVKTAYFSLELPPETLKLRIAREKVGVSKYQLQQKDYSLQQKTSIQKYYNELSNIPNFELLGYEQNPTIDDIEKSILEQVEQGFELFIIDNLGKFATNSTENEAYSLITSRLQTLKNNHDICIVLIHHLNKPKNNEMTQLGGMSKIRGTQKIADNATLLVEVWRDQDPYSKDTTSTISQYKDTIGGTVASQSVQYDRGEYIDLSFE